MSHVIFRVGPIIEAAATVNAYFVCPGDPGSQVFFGQDDRSVLMEIVSVYHPSNLICEPQLALAAHAVGVMTRELTIDEANQLGLMAFELALPGQLSAAKAAAVYQFGVASRIYYEASPWKSLFSYETIGIALTGSIKGRLYARILGSLGTTGGLVLYSSRDSIEQIVNRFESGQFDHAASIDALGVTLEDSPPFAIDAMRRAYGLSRFPLPIKLRLGERVALEDVDLLTLAASLRAVSALSNDSRESEVQLGVDQFEVSALAYW